MGGGFSCSLWEIWRLDCAQRKGWACPVPRTLWLSCLLGGGWRWRGPDVLWSWAQWRHSWYQSKLRKWSWCDSGLARFCCQSRSFWDARKQHQFRRRPGWKLSGRHLHLSSPACTARFTVWCLDRYRSFSWLGQQFTQSLRLCASRLSGQTRPVGKVEVSTSWTVIHGRPFPPSESQQSHTPC